MEPSHLLLAGRQAYTERRWIEAFEQLVAADRDCALEPDDLKLLADSAYLAGQRAWQGALARAHALLCERGELAAAARSAFWLAFAFFDAGDVAQSGGWLARAQSLVDEVGDCAEAGLVLLPGAIEACDRAPGEAIVTFRQAQAIGKRFGDADLYTIARHGEARCLIRLGEPAKGMTVLDSVLVSLMTGELSPVVEGDTYCGALEACGESFDIRRAREWTSILSQWFDSQPGLVAFRGECLVYRSSVMQTSGAWADALAEASQACIKLQELDRPGLGAAYYQRAELQRLRGALADSEGSYRLAGEHGRDPQPGLALLRFAQGNIGAARASVRRALAERTNPHARASVLVAEIELALASDDSAAARTAVDELRRIAAAFDSPFLLAQVASAEGAMRIAKGEYDNALAPLRQAGATFGELDARYEAARVRVLIGAACHALGDRDGAEIEWRAAHNAFCDIGAVPDLHRLATMTGAAPAPTHGLTLRELEILRLVAAGKTNRGIGEELVISEKTVARHISNLFTKLGVSTRSAATAYAYEHGVMQRPT